MASSAANPLRWITPGQLVICIVLFFLPWIDIQCPVPDFNNLKIGGAPPDPKAALKNASYTPLLSQTGLQAATGKYTIEEPLLRQQIEESKRAARNMGVQAQKEDEIKAAPLLWGYLGAVIA